MTTIPRDEIHAIGRRHGVDYDLDFDPTLAWVRAIAARLREGNGFNVPVSPEATAEADDLDALANRYETETA